MPTVSFTFHVIYFLLLNNEQPLRKLITFKFAFFLNKDLLNIFETK
jgi:hypothetical protein